MAKARNLAALAGLAGLAYAMRGNKDKEDAGKSADSSSYAPPDARTKSMDMPTNESSYARNNMTPMQGVGDATNDPIKKPRASAKAMPVAKTTSLPDPRNLESSMTRGRPAAPKTADYSNEGRSSVGSSPTISQQSARDAEAGMSRGTRKTSMAGAGRGFVNPPIPAPKDPREAEAGMSRGTRTTVPPFKGGQKGYDEAGNFMGGQRGFDEAGNPMKKGGSVKKMASGGMTASRRADGIATKGKTRGKIC
jgi:hypothetical protein